MQVTAEKKPGKGRFIPYEYVLHRPTGPKVEGKGISSGKPILLEVSQLPVFQAISFYGSPVLGGMKL
jgi:hypothetical protein